MSGKTRPSQRAKVLSNVDYSNLSYTDKQFIHEMFTLAEKQQAEVVPVVRCRECKHFKTNTDKENYCDIHSTRGDKFYVREEDYCSIGEKR